MNLPVITQETIDALIFIFLRVSAMIAVMPVFGGDRTIPVAVKGGLSLLITFLLFPFVKIDLDAQSLEFIPMFAGMIGEVLIGSIIGFVARFIFAGIQFAGELIGYEMGFSMANVIDPVTSNQVSLISQLQYIVAILIFLTLNGHHVFFSAMAESFERIAPLQFHLSGKLIQTVCLFSKDVFVVAVKVSAPVVAVLVFTNLALGIVARTVPQINIFIIGFPIQIALGFIFLGLTVPVFANYSASLFNNLEKQIHFLIRVM
ncbi:flagellar biosynthetic protein FliR [Syntrophus gentianae]|uniref:Flagellar biosynthetic protein FliR n=1 Tax=Syntrophus gentianae TaxID=43775 RepID=A0A1H7XP24_9BACT|nr:flagellar biosynthetic protein FliR [Syntrophus gentianae]SEM35384.1 flagellar biosynthetic protein FliR [Syntrophus gentianae]